MPFPPEVIITLSLVKPCHPGVSNQGLRKRPYNFLDDPLFSGIPAETSKWKWQASKIGKREAAVFTKSHVLRMTAIRRIAAVCIHHSYQEHPKTFTLQFRTP